MKRPENLAGTSAETAEFPDDLWKKTLPLIVEYLTATKYDDGTERKLSSISIKEQDGSVLVALNDADLDRGLYRTGKTVVDALKAIEKALATDSADWRVWKREQRGKKKG